MGFFTAFREDVYPVEPFAPLPGGPAFSLTTAGSLVWAAQLAYEVESRAKFERIIARWGWQNAGIVLRDFASRWQRAKARGFVAKAGDATVIAFAGTEPEDVVEWEQDFTVWFDGGGVHEGFENGVTAAWCDIVAAAKNAAGGVYLAGHSLGAALAVVAAARLVECSVLPADRILGVYTVGTPRVGNAEYAAAYPGMLDERTFRLIHGEDLVTMVPLESLGFRHVGRWLAAPRRGGFVGAPTNAPPPAHEFPPFADPFLGLPDGGAPAYPAENPLAIVAVAALPAILRDHMTDGYLRALGVLA